MIRQAIRELIEGIHPLDELEASHQEDVLQWIDSEVELCRIAKPAVPPKHLVSYCLLLDQERELLLLVDHKKSGLWLPAGGHVEPKEHPKETADRELFEELGVHLPLLLEEPLLLTVTGTVGAVESHIDVSLWYVYLADSSVEIQFDPREFHGVKWFPLKDLPFNHSDPHLKRFCHKLDLLSAVKDYTKP